jgi:hypothetical protein
MANVRPVKIVDIGEGQAEFHEFGDGDLLEIIENIIHKTSSNKTISQNVEIDDVLRWNIALATQDTGAYSINRHTSSGHYLDSPFAIDLTAGNLWHKGKKLMDMGANANGLYVRFSNGIQICGKTSFSISASGNQWWTYPAAFTASINHGGFAISPWGHNGGRGFVSNSGTGTSVALSYVNGSGSLVAGTVSMIAFGAWTS